MPPKTRSSKSIELSPVLNSDTPRKRDGANFSTILTPRTPQRTFSQTEVNSRRLRELAKEYQTTPLVEGNFKSNVQQLITKFDQIKPERKSTKKVKVASATSQNHIISDKYLGEILESAIARIRQYAISSNKTKITLAAKQRQAVEDFFKKIFHKTENKELKRSLEQLEGYLRPDGAGPNTKLLQNLCSYVAARGSNNAVEGDASANSGIGEDMDAQVDLQGRLLPPYAVMRSSFIELCNIVSMTIKDDDTIGRDKLLHALTLKAISPNLVGNKIRYSSKAYKGDVGDGKYYESPSILQDTKGNFRTGDLIDQPKITPSKSKKNISEAQLRHSEQGFLSFRPSTPTASRKASYHHGQIQDLEGGAEQYSNPNLATIPFILSNDDYSDDQLNQLFRLCLAPDTHYVEPAIALAEGQLNEALNNFIANAATKLVIAIHADNHYMGIFIEKKGSEFSITYFDPTISYEDRSPLHDIPNNIKQSLAQKFPNVEINSISSAIQSYHVEADTQIIDNNHCGPFVCYFMSLMAKGEARLSQDGSNRIEIKINNQWQNIDILNSENSNKAGVKIRDWHDSVIVAPDTAMNSVIDLNCNEDLPSTTTSVKDIIKNFEKLSTHNNEKLL